jgi:hypothetical protein
MAVMQEATAEVTADETGSAGDEDMHTRIDFDSRLLEYPKVLSSKVILLNLYSARLSLATLLRRVARHKRP